MTEYINNFKTSSNKEKLRILLVFLIMCVAFSIPFGDKYARVLISLIFILWLFFIKFEDIKPLFKNKIIIILFLFIMSHYLTLIWSENISNGLHIISQQWRYIFIPIVLYITILEKKDIKYVLTAFIFGMFINEIISYLIYFNLYETDFSKVNRYPVGFINHVYYSIFVAFCAVLILYQSRDMKNIYLKIIYTMFFITMTINLVISGGRTGYIVYFASLLILLFIYYRFSIKNLFQILLFPILVFYIGYKFNSDVQARFNATSNSLEQLGSKANYNSSLGTRISFYPLTYDMLKQKENSFIFGVGTGDIKVELNKAIKRTKILNSSQPHLHNSYLMAYANAGILALFSLLLLFYFLFKLKINDKELKFIQYLFLLIFTIGSLSANLLATRVTMVYFSIFIALILINKLKEEHEHFQEN